MKKPSQQYKSHTRAKRMRNRTKKLRTYDYYRSRRLTKLHEWEFLGDWQNFWDIGSH